jgi:hypothetical protein
LLRNPTSPRPRGEVVEADVASSSGNKSRKETPSLGVARINFLV